MVMYLKKILIKKCPVIIGHPVHQHFKILWEDILKV